MYVNVLILHWHNVYSLNTDKSIIIISMISSKGNFQRKIKHQLKSGTELIL